MRYKNSWRIPENAKSFFSPKYEKQQREKYGVWYTVHAVLSILILLGCVFFYFAQVPNNALTPATQMGNALSALFFLIGVLGSVAVGMGLVNVFMAIVKQYLGHWVTMLALLGGMALETAALFLLSLVK